MSSKPTLPAKRSVPEPQNGKRTKVIEDDDEEVKQPAQKFLKTSDDNKKAVVVEDSSDDEDGNGAKNKIKWKSLEHHGVIFFPPYKPHGVQLYHLGKPIKLTQEQEEACNWWAQVEGSEFAEKELVKKNFESTLLGMLDSKKLGIKNFKDLDFSKIKQHLDEQREARKNRPIEERKREQEEKNKTEGYYKYCLFDGEIEKVSNCLVEPPGIFRGRGEHPHAGRIKQRVVPEFVSLNVGQDDPIPICPIPGHAWKRVQSNPEATWLCQFKDERSKYANGKYVFLAAESKIKGENDKKKYEKARRLKGCIKDIRLNYTQKFSSKDEADNQLGVCTYLIDKLALRVGNEKGEDEADTVGCCSLKVQHVSFPANNTIKLDFLGKDSIRYENTVEVLPQVYQNLVKFSNGKGPDDLIFDKINTGRLNDYLKSMMNDLSAKVFRTYNASITLSDQLFEENEHGIDPATVPAMPLDKRVQFYRDCNREVARLCNHQKAVAKNFDEQVQKMQQKIDEITAKHQALQKLLPQIKKGKLPEDPKLPKSVEACQTAIEKEGKKVETENLKLEEKIKGKNLALGTSKINYMDPRISISWCKENEVPIEKVFEKTLRSKFAWAMDNDPSWRF